MYDKLRKISDCARNAKLSRKESAEEASQMAIEMVVRGKIILSGETISEDEILKRIEIYESQKDEKRRVKALVASLITSALILMSIYYFFYL